MATGNGVLEVDEVLELALEVTAEVVHVQIVGVLAEGVLDLTTNTLHTEKGEGDEGHEGDGVPAEVPDEGEGEGESVQVHDLTPIFSLNVIRQGKEVVRDEYQSTQRSRVEEKSLSEKAREWDLQVDRVGEGDGGEDDTLHVGKDIGHGVDGSQKVSNQRALNTTSTGFAQNPKRQSIGNLEGQGHLTLIVSRANGPGVLVVVTLTISKSLVMNNLDLNVVSSGAGGETFGEEVFEIEVADTKLLTQMVLDRDGVGEEELDDEDLLVIVRVVEFGQSVRGGVLAVGADLSRVATKEVETVAGGSNGGSSGGAGGRGSSGERDIGSGSVDLMVGLLHTDPDHARKVTHLNIQRRPQLATLPETIIGSVGTERQDQTDNDGQRRNYCVCFLFVFFCYRGVKKEK